MALSLIAAHCADCGAELDYRVAPDALPQLCFVDVEARWRLARANGETDDAEYVNGLAEVVMVDLTHDREGWPA
jgi:hypothetical protein